jgi:hypothetical protein
MSMETYTLELSEDTEGNELIPNCTISTGWSKHPNGSPTTISRSQPRVMSATRRNERDRRPPT